MRGFCVSVLFFIGSFSLTFAVELICYYKDSGVTKYETATLDEPEVLINSSCLDITRCTHFYTHGYRGKVNGTATEAAKKTFLEQGLCNYILVNWEKEASSGDSQLEISLEYGLKAISAAISNGIKFGKALIRLIKYGLDLAKVHLVGHSLGAHFMGYAGTTVTELIKACVQRITGLDPAGPFYNSASIVLKPLDSTCACFVDCIHTNPGNYGINKSGCTVDIWFNYGAFLNGTNLQPGCPSGDYPKFSNEDLCSHDRSWKVEYLAILNKGLFIASKGANYYDWESQDGESNDTICLGDDIDFKAFGNFYLSTTGVEPYGKGKDGLAP